MIRNELLRYIKLGCTRTQILPCFHLQLDPLQRSVVSIARCYRAPCFEWTYKSTSAWRLAVRIFQLIPCTVQYPAAFTEPSEQTVLISSYGFDRVDRAKSRFTEYRSHELGKQFGRTVGATSQMYSYLSQREWSRLHYRPECR
jgi:hypothetical protein